MKENNDDNDIMISDDEYYYHLMSHFPKLKYKIDFDEIIRLTVIHPYNSLKFILSKYNRAKKGE